MQNTYTPRRTRGQRYTTTYKPGKIMLLEHNGHTADPINEYVDYQNQFGRWESTDRKDAARRLQLWRAFGLTITREEV
jgi:hypothetical protein